MHQTGWCDYELVGARTGSIRDQMLRSARLADEFFKGPDREMPKGSAVLILGGGAAGAALAMAASYAGVIAVVVERHDAMFVTQLGVTTRRVCPTEFDWPQPHWLGGWAPEHSNEPPFVLGYSGPGWAADYAREWQDEFREHTEESAREGAPLGRIHFVKNTDCYEIALRACYDPVRECLVDGYRIELDVPEVDALTFAAVVSCVGLGRERVFLTKSGIDDDPEILWNGAPFWSSDGLCNKDFQQRKATSIFSENYWPLFALVSGGGDGAQQDIQRMLCGDFGRPLLVGEGKVFEAVPAIKDRLDAQMETFWNADVARYEVLSDPAATDEQKREASRVWDDNYVAFTKNLWKSLIPEERVALRNALLRKEVVQAKLRLTWLMKGERPDYCYGLNRFLTELVLTVYADYIDRDVRKEDSWETFMPVTILGHQVLSVETATRRHQCKLDRPDLCLGPAHRVVFARADERVKHFVRDYHFVILRHGIVANMPFGGMRVREQLMPFGLRRGAATMPKSARKSSKGKWSGTSRRGPSPYGDHSSPD